MSASASQPPTSRGSEASGPAFPQLPPGYTLTRGSPLDRTLLLQFLVQAYRELGLDQEPAPLIQTVDHHLSPETPLWWVQAGTGEGAPVGCLWVGNGIDLRQGDRHAYVLLLYVVPAQRRRGLATALLDQAHRWAAARGDRQIALQVFSTNQPAQRLYAKLGYVPQAVLMAKPLTDPTPD